MTLKISVLLSGAVLMDGKPVGLAQLDEAFRVAKENNGTVLYYQEAASSEGPPEAMEVIKLVIKYKLPIGLSQKPDFSDMVGQDSCRPIFNRPSRVEVQHPNRPIENRPAG